MDVGSLLEHHARYRPDSPAVVCGAHRATHAEHACDVRRAARALSTLGLVSGDRLALVMGNCIELLHIYRAAAALGLVTVPLSPLLLEPALVSLLRDSDSAAVIADAGSAARIDAACERLGSIPRERIRVVGGNGSAPGRDWGEHVRTAADAAPIAAPVDPDHPCNIIYSSGTTGMPKGIVLTHRIRALYALLFAQRFGITLDCTVMHAGSLVFNGAFPTLMAAWSTGCRYVLLERFDPAAWIEAVRAEAVTHAIVVPSQLAALLHAPGFTKDALRSLRMVCSLGAPLPREHKEQLLRVLPDGALWELYGLTEGFVTVLDGHDLPTHLDSVGTPLAFGAMRIVDEGGRDLGAGEIGEILGRGPLLTPGYWGRPDLTAEAIVGGWLRTGDVGFVDAAGYLHLVDRHKDMIISGGVNVFPRDIEEVAARHPAVREVAVYGVPDARWGESPVAAIVCREGARATAAELRDWINTNVGATWQRLREVLVVDELPRNIAGKTLKRELRERHPAPPASPKGDGGN